MENIVVIVALFAISAITCLSICAIVSIYLRKPLDFKQCSKIDNVIHEMAISMIDKEKNEKKNS